MWILGKYPAGYLVEDDLVAVDVDAEIFDFHDQEPGYVPPQLFPRGFLQLIFETIHKLFGGQSRPFEIKDPCWTLSVGELPAHDVFSAVVRRRLQFVADLGDGFVL